MGIVEQLRQRIAQSGMSLYAVAKGAGVPYQVIHRFANRQRAGVGLATAEKLAAAIGIKLELRPARRARKG